MWISSNIPDSVDYTFTKEIEKDTIYLWLTRNSFDSLNFNLIEKDTTKLTTVKFDRKRDTLIDSLSINAKTANVIHLRESFKLSSNIPIKKIEDSLISIRDIDSLSVPFATSLNDNLDEIDIKFEVSPSDNYRIFILPNAIRDIKGVTNDTLQFNLVSQALEDYGNIYLDVIRNSQSKFILHLLNSNGDIIREYNNVNQNSTFNFDYIRPGKDLEIPPAMGAVDRSRTCRWTGAPKQNDISLGTVRCRGGLFVSAQVRSEWKAGSKCPPKATLPDETTQKPMC